VEPGTVLLPHLVIVIGLLGFAWAGRRAAWLPALPLLDAVLLAVYVFGEDTYRGDISRWDAYRSPGGALGAMFVLSLVLLASCAALLAFAAVRDRARLFRLAALAGAAGGIFLVLPTIIGFGAN
jgi:hypothetical protein